MLIERFRLALTAAGLAGGVHYAINERDPVRYPYAIFIRTATPTNHTLRGRTDVQQSIFQVDVFARSIREAQTLAREVEQQVAAAFPQSVRNSGFDQYEDLVKAYRVTQEFSVWATD